MSGTSKGFTLLEVVISILVLSIFFGSLFYFSSQTFKNLKYCLLFWEDLITVDSAYKKQMYSKVETKIVRNKGIELFLLKKGRLSFMEIH